MYLCILRVFSEKRCHELKKKKKKKVVSVNMDTDGSLHRICLHLVPR